MPDPAVRSQLETQLGHTLARALNPSLQALPADVQTRLRFAREQALKRRAQTSAQCTALVATGKSGALGQVGGIGWWSRLGWLLPLLAVAGGAWLVQSRHERDAAAVAAQIDTALLTDELPPAAYADPGFVAFLKLQPP